MFLGAENTRFSTFSGSSWGLEWGAGRPWEVLGVLKGEARGWEALRSWGGGNLEKRVVSVLWLPTHRNHALFNFQVSRAFFRGSIQARSASLYPRIDSDEVAEHSPESASAAQTPMASFHAVCLWSGTKACGLLPVRPQTS